jgi:hypothetical protein
MFLLTTSSKRYILLVSLAFFYSSTTYCQDLEANYWYFGFGAGLQFLPNGPRADTNSTAMSPNAVASISDSNGRLLFYTDRHHIYNSNHAIMQGGNNIFSGNDFRRIIVNKPNSNIYYTFSTQTTGIYSHVLNTVEVDINRNNGLGEAKLITTAFNKRVNSVLSVIKSINDTNYFLILHSDTGDRFYSIPITTTGIQWNSIDTSKIGYSLPSPNLMRNMKSSPNSELIATCCAYPDIVFEIFKINRLTGQIDSLIYSRKYSPLNEVYSCSFTPNNSAIIISKRNELIGFSLKSLDSTLIAQSIKTLDSIPINNNFLDLQIGIDGQLYYLTNWAPYGNPPNKISRINCPDQVLDSLSKQDTIIPLFRYPGSQFPTLNQTLYVNAHKLQAQNLGPAVACAGSPSQLVAYGASKDDFSWSPSTGLSCSNCSSPIARPTQTTTYRVIARATSCKQDKLDTAFVTVTVKDPPPNIALNPDSVVCAGDSLPLFVARPHYFLVWSTGDTADTLFAKQPGLYSATAYGYCFVAPVSRQVYVRPQPALAVSPRDTTVCAGEPVLLRASTPDTALQWLTFATTDTLRVSAPGVYVAQVQNACGTLTDTATVRHSQPSAQFVADSTEGFAPFAFSAFSKPGKLQRRWLLNGQDVGSDSVLRVINLPTDTYDLVLAVVDSIGCTDTSRLQLKVFPPPVPPEPPVPEPEPEPDTPDSTHRDCQIKVFPNPFHTEFVVKAVVSTHKIKEVRLVSTEGKILFEEAMPAGVNPLHLHLSSHPAAVYMLNYSCKGNTYRVKVVKGE